MNKQEFFDELIEKLGDVYTWKNINDVDIECDDYVDEIIPFQKVEEDRNLCIQYVMNFLNDTADISEKEIVLVMYSNFFIRYGMASRYEKEERYSEYDGLENVFNNLSVDKEHLIKVYLAAKYQDNNAWDEILIYNNNSIVSKLYIFVKLCYEYSREISKQINRNSVDVNNYKGMWELYEKLPDVWKEYVLGSNEVNGEGTNHAISNRLLPYMDFKPLKEILSDYISMYYKCILNKLEIRSTVSSGFAYSEIIKALGVQSLIDFFIGERPKGFENIEQEKMFILNIVKHVFNFIFQLNKANEDADITFLVEKIHDLSFEDLERAEWLDSKYVLEEYSWSDMYPAMRASYLHIPVHADMHRSLFESQFEVYIKNRELKKNAEQKREMMDYYAHSWKHISYPQIVKEIAEELGKTNRIVANRLMKAYNSERTLQRGIQLLQYISSDDERKVSIEFRKGIAKSGSDAPDFLNIFRVICDSLDLVIFKILMVESDDSSSIKKCREKWKLRNSLDKLREEYTALFLEEKVNNCNIFEWTKTNLIDLKLDISNEWKDVRFKEDSFAINQFKEIFVEIFTNIFIHGEAYAKMNFSANENEMIISETNICTDINPGSQSGISTMRKVLEYLNVGTDIRSLDIELEEEYTLIIKLNKKLLIRKGR